MIDDLWKTELEKQNKNIKEEVTNKALHLFLYIPRKYQACFCIFRDTLSL